MHWRASQFIRCMPIASGTLWAGTFRGGLVRFKNGKFSRITAKQGLPVGIISQIMEDNDGRLWLGTHQGIFCVTKPALNACMDGAATSVDYIAYGRHERFARAGMFRWLSAGVLARAGWKIVVHHRARRGVGEPG